VQTVLTCGSTVVSEQEQHAIAQGMYSTRGGGELGVPADLSGAELIRDGLFFAEDHTAALVSLHSSAILHNQSRGEHTRCSFADVCAASTIILMIDEATNRKCIQFEQHLGFSVLVRDCQSRTALLREAELLSDEENDDDDDDGLANLALEMDAHSRFY
jgi:hypothetical protein